MTVGKTYGALAPLAPGPARYTSDRLTDCRPDPSTPGKPRGVVGGAGTESLQRLPSHERVDHPARPGLGPGSAAEPVTASSDRPGMTGWREPKEVHCATHESARAHLARYPCAGACGLWSESLVRAIGGPGPLWLTGPPADSDPTLAGL